MTETFSRRHLLGFAAGAAVLGCATARNRPVARVRSVIILGGGLSGLAAGFELSSRGFDVRLLEAQARPGGRIRTIRTPLPEGLYVEAGATHVVGDPDLMALLKRLQVPLEKPRRRGWPRRVMFRNGVRTVVDANAPLPPDGPPLSADEEALGFQKQLEHYFGNPAEHDPRHADWPPRELVSVDQLTGAEYLRQRGASPGYLAFAQHALCPNGDIHAISALAMIREALSFQLELGWDDWRVVGGADGIVTALAARLGDRIVSEAHVTRVEQTSAGATVTFRRRGAMEHLSATHVICALPGPVVPQLEWSPALPAPQRCAFEDLRMTAATRVFVASRTRFWNARGESGDTDAPLGVVRDVTSSPSSTAGVLVLDTGGAEAQRLGRMNEPSRVAEAVDVLSLVHPGIREQVCATASVSWSEDPLFRGAFAWLAPGQLTTQQPELRRPHGPIHFAGDYLSHRPGFMHGALSSARRVVDDIVALESGAVRAR